MATEDRKAQLRFGVDTSEVKRGTADIKRDVREMAQDVQQSGQQAAKGIQAIGDGAPAAAQKLNGATKSIIGSIERATAAMQAGEKGSASYFEALAKQRGANVDVLKPYIEQLRQAEEAQRVASGSLNNMGMSAKATAAALRGVPAQFSDIFTSIQGGMPVMTVITQQGLQLRDMFGGFVPALKAVGTTALGLVTPFTAAGAAIAALGYAMYKAEDSLRSSNSIAVQLQATGRAADLTREDIKALQRELALMPDISKAAAKAIVGEFVQTREVGGKLFKDLALSVADFAAATGTDAPTAAKTLAQAFNDPAKGAKQLDEALNILTASQALTIESMLKVGDKAGAQQVLFDALKASVQGLAKDAATPLKDSLNDLGNAWTHLGETFSKTDGLREANTVLAGIVRSLTWIVEHGASVRLNFRTEGLADVDRQLGLDRIRSARNPAPASTGGASGSWDPAPTSVAAPVVTGLDDQVKAALETTKSYKSLASSMADVRAQGDLVRATLESLEEAGRGNSKEAEELRARLDGVNERLETMGKKALASQAVGQSEIATIRAKIKEEEAYIARLRDRGAEASKLTEGERLVAKIQEELTGKLDARTRAAKQLALAEAERLATVQKTRVEEERSIKNQQESEAAYRKFLDGIYKGADATNKQAEAQEAANASFGKSKTAIAEMNLEQMKLSRDMAKNAGPWTPEHLAAMDAAIDAQERWVRSLQAGDLKTINAHTDELLRAAKEQAKVYEDEGKLAGLTRLEREKIVALRQVELKYAKELEKIERSGLSDEDKAEQRGKVEQAKRIEGEAAVAKVVQDDWNRTSDEINRSLTDALQRGFESGKGFAENLRDTLKNMFNTLVLRPVISAILAPVSGAISGMVNGVMGGVTGGGGGGGFGAADIFSMGKSIYSAITGGFTTLTNNIAMYAQQGINFVSGAGPMTAGQLPGAAAQGVGLAGSYLAGAYGGIMGGRMISGGYSAIGSSGNTAVNVGTAIGAIFGPLGALVGGLIGGAVNRLFGRKLADTGIEGDFGGEQGFAGRTYQFYKGGAFRSNKTKYGELDEEVRKGLADQYTAMRDSIKEMGKVLGLGGEALDKFTAHIKVSLHGLSPEDAQKKLQEEFEKLGISMADMILGLPSSIQDAANDRKYLFGVNPDPTPAAVDPVAEANAEAFRKLQKAGESSLDTLTRLATSLAATNGVFEMLGHSLYAASLQGGDMASKLVDLFGGVDKFAAANADYFQRYYTPGDQREFAKRQIEKELATVDIKLPDINADDARAQYRKLVEAQDLNTEAGRKAYAVLIQLAGAFDQVAISADTRRGLEERLLAAQGNDRAVIEMRRKQERDALMQLDPALARLVQQIYDLEDATAVADKRVDLYQRLLTAQGKDREALALRRSQEVAALMKLDPELAKLVQRIYDLEDAASAAAQLRQDREKAYGRLQNAATLESERLNAQLQAIDAQRTALGQQRALADESLSLITGIFDLVRSNARELYGQVESTASMQAAAGWAFVERALETARLTGYLPDQAPLQEAIGAARGGVDSRAYATQFEQDRDRLVLAGMLSGLESISGKQKTAAEQQIKLLEDQGKALDLQTETINRQLKAQQEMLEYWRRQLDIANGTFDATVSVASAIDKLATALGKPPTTPTTTKPPQGGGSGAVWGGTSPGAGSTPPPAEAKYRRVSYLGTAGIGYEPVIDQALIAKLDGLSGLYHSFDGTGDLIGLLTAIRSAGGTLDDLSILSGYFYSDWVKAAASVGVPAFAVGTNYVPYDTPAIVHKGERIIPAADNRALMAALDRSGQGVDGAVLAELQALRAEVAALRAAGERTADNTTRLPAMAEQFEDVTGGGNAMRMEAMS
ncbi:phage tail length tape measure family protein [Acidovorax cattleyae]|nr:phage tail length tape measure family protein [Paracidovorax cattleyae]